MKIIIDEKIPFIKGAFEPFADVIYKPGREIDHNIVSDADALIIRTRTKCNSELLKESRVKIIASATIGYDHIDTVWCESAGIKWVNAPGCNSGSVMQYVVASLFHLASIHSFDIGSMTLGVVGVGNVGSKVVTAAKAMGMNVLQNDPPRQRKEKSSDFIPLKELLKKSDLVTLHVPLTKSGPDKTYYLMSHDTLSLMKSDSIMINTSRGEVVNNQALKNALKSGLIAGAVLDVWEGEPLADRELIDLVDIATPHIAGYSVDGKANATTAVVHQVAEELGIPLLSWKPSSLPMPEKESLELLSGNRYTARELSALAVHHSYPVTEDDKLFRDNPEKFEYLRDNYRKRREFSSFTIVVKNREAKKIIENLGFNTL